MSTHLKAVKIGGTDEASSVRSRPKTLKNLRLDEGRFVIQQLREGEPGAPQVVCFPFVGGGPLGFKAFSEQLPKEWSVWAVDFPGHVRTQGEALTTVEELVAECLRLMPMELLTGSYFLGTSLGGYVAHALAAELERQGHTVPGVIIAGATPVSIRTLSTPLSSLDDEACFKWMMCGGQDSRPHPSDTRRVLFDVFKTAIRADLEAYDSYSPTNRIQAPVLVIGGTEDPLCTPEEFAAWGEHTFDPEIEIVQGGHFFINANPKKVARCMTKFIERLSMAASGEVRVVSDVSAIREVGNVVPAPVKIFKIA